MDEDINSKIGNTLKNRTKQVAKMILKKSMKPLLIGAGIFLIVVIIISVVTWYIKKHDTKEDDKDPKNAPAAVRNYMSDTSIDENGNITAGKSIQEFWDEIRQSGNRATAYLNSAEELGKLIYAARALEYPDTRKNPDEAIQWNDLDINSKEIQGIVKFKRALANGKNISMTYVNPTEFQELINKYQSSGDVKDRNEALKHFTIEKTSSTSNGDTGTAGKVPSLRGMVFMGDSILSTFNEFKGNELKNQEGAILMYKSGCNASYFTGKKTVDHNDYNTIETSDGHFDWNANFQKVSNPTGFYLMLGQNALFNDDRIDEIDELVKKIRSNYPTPPIFISSVLHYIDSDGSAKKKAAEMNEELKEYCNRNDNVYFSDILRGYNDNLEALTKSDNDHPNEKGVQILLDNIKANIVGSSSSLQEILKYACSWRGKITYEFGGKNLLKDGGTSDCSHFVHRVFGHFGVMDNSDGGFVHSYDWGEGAPGTVKIGTDISKASPGDVIWENYSRDANHVSIYLGNGKRIECAAGKGDRKAVGVTNVPKKINQILHFSQFPTDTSAYFDPETGILHSSNNVSTSNSGSTSYTSTSTTSVNTTSNASGTGITASTIEDIAKTNRNYNNDALDADIKISTQKKMSNPFQNNREYRSSQSACYDGKYIIHFQNKNYGSVDASSRGGRIAWTNIETGDIDYTVEVGEEGGHGDGLAYDSERNMVLKYSSSGEGNLLQIDNNTKTIVGHTKMSSNSADMTYLNTIKQLVALDNHKFVYMKYDQAKNEYVKQKEFVVENLNINTGLQGIGTDGQVIYVADSAPGSSSSNYRVWTFTLDGKRVEEHRIGSGYDDCEVEAALSDNQGRLWMICNQHIYSVKNYKANPANVNPGSSSTTTSSTANMTYQVKVATWSERQDKVSSNDPEVSSYDTGMIPSMTTTTIPYQAIVSKYKMPFNYLWTMLVYSNDKNYTFDLADLVKNSKIEITIHDNLNETTNIVTDTYTDYTKIHAEADVNISYENVSYVTDYVTDPVTNTVNQSTREIVSDSSTTKHGKGDGDKSVSYKVVQTTITKTNTLDIALTLADAWCTKYEKKYTYNKPNTTESNSSTNLEDIPEDPYTNQGELGGQEGKVDEDAKNQARASDRRNLHVTGRENEFATYQTTRINRVKNTYTKMTTSSYFSAGGTNIDRSEITTASTPKTGSLNPANYAALIEPSTHRDGNNPLQGFCLVGDDMVAYVILHYSGGEHCTLYLADINTMQIYDKMEGFVGHGNTIAYDSVTGDIIFPESGSKIGLVTVNKSTRKFENRRAISPPQQAYYPSFMAYNATHDLFIANAKVYTRQAFYSGGSPIKNLENPILNKRHNYAGSTSYGNHVYYYFAEGYGHSKNYFVVCDLNTGKQVEIIRDDMARESEEASFSSDGTLYTAYAESGPTFYKTDYNYFADNNIDKSNVNPNGSSTANEFARYNTGGEYTEKTSFEKVFNSHYNARSNILSATGWLFEALEQNKDTSKMVDLTKYLLYKATGQNFGVTEFNFEEYDPDGFNQVSSGIYGNTPQEKVWFALRGAGFSEYAVAGAMGNIEAESGFRQDAIEGGTGIGFGLCQWSFGRRTQLENYAKSKGKEPSDIEVQIEFLLGELTPGGGADGYANYQFGSNGENWKNASSVDQATELYCRYFERPNMAVAHMDRRKEAANKYYNEFHGKTAPTGGTGSGTAISACQSVSQYIYGKNITYSIEGKKLIYGNIDRCYNESNYMCCATYVSCVLYKSGLLSANQINKYNYHYTGSGGIPDMLQAAGWRKVSVNEAQPGDVVNIYGYHVLIYAGGDLYWDETTCVICKGKTRTNAAKSGFSYYKNSSHGEVQVWRAPGK